MIYPEVNAKEWQRRFNLPIVEAPCGMCKETFRTTVPVLVQGCAGLATPIHDCGKDFVEVILTPKTESAHLLWDSITNNDLVP